MACRIYEEEYYTLLHTKNKSTGPCGFREDFSAVCPIVRLWELMTPRVGPFLTPGASSSEALDLVVSKKISHYKPLADNDAPRAGACMDLRGTIGRIYKEKYSTLLYTKYESSESCSFREEDFLFSHYKVMGANDPRAGAIFDPRAWLDLCRAAHVIGAYQI